MDELLNSGYIHGIRDIASISNIGVEYRNNYEARRLNNKALKLSYQGKYEAAIKLYTEAIGFNENDAILYYNRAVSYYKLQHYEPMIPDLTKALELCKEAEKFNTKQYKNILDFRNSTYFILEQFEKALEDINAIILIDTLHADYFFRRARVYSKLDSLSLSQKDYKKAISMDSTRSEFYYGSSANYYFMKQYTKSLEDANKCLMYCDDDHKLWGYFVRGYALFELKKFYQANQDFEKYLSFEQDDNPPYLALAAINYELKNYEQAEIYFIKADSLKNNGIDVKWDEDDYEWNSTLLKSILEEWGKL
jgi:tetratricopeptide (TPR) repeat protein